jgi:hypothetical protein
MTELPDIPGYNIITLLSKGGIARVYLGIQEGGIGDTQKNEKKFEKGIDNLIPL